MGNFFRPRSLSLVSGSMSFNFTLPVSGCLSSMCTIDYSMVHISRFDYRANRAEKFYFFIFICSDLWFRSGFVFWIFLSCSSRGESRFHFLPRGVWKAIHYPSTRRFQSSGNHQPPFAFQRHRFFHRHSPLTLNPEPGTYIDHSSPFFHRSPAL